MDIQNGSVWRVVSPPGENILAFVGLVAEKAVHCAVLGFRVRVPDPRGLIDSNLRCSVIGHSCFTQDKFEESVFEELTSADLNNDPALKHEVSEILRESAVSDAEELFHLFQEGLREYKLQGGEPFDETILQAIDKFREVVTLGPPHVVED